MEIKRICTIFIINMTPNQYLWYFLALIFKYFIESTVTAVLMIMWLAGFVIAKGFWSTAFCFFMPYAWYLVIEKLMIINHLT